MPETTFVPGQHVYHRPSGETVAYVQQSEYGDESIVDFPDGGWTYVTTAQLVPADEVEENG